MLLQHRGARPEIDPTAVVAPGALISGDVQVGPYCCILAGAVLTSEGAPIRIGERCVIMENAVVRGAGIHPCMIDDHVLIGPHAHISGARIGRCSFVGTGASIFNGAIVGDGSVASIRAVIHISSRCPPGTIVPIGHVAIGDPLVVYAPDQAADALAEVARLGFTKIVFGFDSSSMTNADATRELCDRYTHVLSHHSYDRII